MHMFNKKELCIRHPIYQVTNRFHKLLSRVLMKLIIATNKESMQKIIDFVNYTFKTLNRQNAFYTFKNIWCTFMMPLDEAPLHLSDKSEHRRVIAQWRLKIGR